MASSAKVYTTFSDFYPFYIAEHTNRINRTLHFVGTNIVVMIFIAALLTGRVKLLLLAPLCGYGFAWVGHFFFQ